MMKKNIETYLADAAPCTRVTLVLGISVNRIFLILAEFGHSDRNGGILCKKRKNSAKIGMVGSYASGLLRTECKRPDGATLIPWSAGRYMAWDATVVHTCAASYLSQTAISAGSAAEQAAVHKTAKYALLPATHVFVPIAFETLWPVNGEGAEFLSELGRRISSVSGDQRETNFLLQHLSICVQHHNAIAFRGTFQDGREAWDEA